VKELWYEKRSNKPDIDNLSSPLLYHLFGKANTIPNSYVLTEDDLLEFIHCWLYENYRPQQLANTLKEKYLLVIGCNYPNWLFRFFIQSMKNFSNTGTSKNSKIGMIADSKLSSDLLAFLSRISAQTHGNSITFIDELSERWKQHSKTNSEEKEEKEIFISYASEDYETAQKIADAFGNAGGQVWFDKRELDPSDKYAEIIRNKIKNSKAFVPILSLNTLTKEKRFFKGEWNWGIKEAELMGTQKFIYPIVIEEIDKASDILPEEFKEKHMIDYKNKDFENNIKKIIRDIR
jgi:hypothetical protein